MNTNNEIEKLEQELKLAKSKLLKQEWEAYLDKVKTFCCTLVNRVILCETTAGHYVMYKVTGFEEKYYADITGYYGQFGPERWIELTTEGYLRFTVCNEPTIQSLSSNQHKFIFNKGSRLNIAKLNFTSADMASCVFEAKEITKFGYTVYNEYKNSPSFDRALQALTTFAKVMPDNSFYEEAKRIYFKHVEDVKNFWLENEHQLDGLQPVGSIYQSIN